MEESSGRKIVDHFCLFALFEWGSMEDLLWGGVMTRLVSVTSDIIRMGCSSRLCSVTP